MNRLLPLLLALPFVACASTGGTVDLAAIADKTELYRADLVDVVGPLLTKSENQAALKRLSDATLQVEAALRAAGAGGPIADFQTAAAAALEIADQVILQLQASGRDTGDAQAVVGLAKVLLRHLAAGDTAGAARI